MRKSFLISKRYLCMISESNQFGNVTFCVLVLPFLKFFSVFQFTPLTLTESVLIVNEALSLFLQAYISMQA